jgi:hypothetical protein
VGSALPADGMRPVTRADCTHDSTDAANARIWWHAGPSTAAPIWLVINNDRAPRIIFGSDLLRHVDVRKKARDSVERISNLTPRNG